MSKEKQIKVVAPHKKRPRGFPKDMARKSNYAESYASAPDSHVHVLLHLAQGMTVEEVSRRTGRGVEMVRRVMTHPPYRDWLDEQQRKFMEGHIEHAVKLAEAKGEMADILLDLIRREDSKPNERLSALKYYGELTGMSGKGHSVNHIKAELSMAPSVSGPSDALRLRVIEAASTLQEKDTDVIEIDTDVI